MYVPVKNALRIDGNIDNEERMYILTRYKDCMLKSFKENVDQAAMMRKNLKNELLNGLIFANDCELASLQDNLNLVQSNATYYNCGYIIFSREKEINCKACVSTLTTDRSELPSDFHASHITDLKNKGFLRFASLSFYYTIAKVETILQQHFKTDSAYMMDSFEQAIMTVVGDKLVLPNICCDEHRAEMVPYLIYEYVEFRYHVEAKRFKNDTLQKLKEKQQAHRKIAKMVV